MNIEMIKPSVERIVGDDPLKKIEIAARTCYKSEANITDDSSIRMVKRLIKNKHYAMLEHALFEFHIYNKPATRDLLEKCRKSKFCRVCYGSIFNKECNFVFINLRTIIEEEFAEFWVLLEERFPQFRELRDVAFENNQLEFVVRRGVTLSKFPEWNTLTVKIVCDRGVSHELVRHRTFSFAQESQRYVNYKKNDCFQFIEPSTFADWDERVQKDYLICLANCAETYNKMIESNRTPQEARAILPNSTKTEIVMTGDRYAWKHFIDLRYYETTGKVHPEMRIIADKIFDIWHPLSDGDGRFVADTTDGKIHLHKFRAAYNYDAWVGSYVGDMSNYVYDEGVKDFVKDVGDLIDY